MNKSFITDIKTLNKIEEDDNAKIGAKAKNFKIIQQKTAYQIPKTLVLTTGLYKYLVDYNKIKNPFTFKWKNFRIPIECEKVIIKEIEKVFKQKTLVIRSSATCEDSLYSSFAGIFSSFLKINGKENILESIRFCYTSLFSEEAKIYARYHDIKLKHEAMAIIIQEFVSVDESGVMFTANPITKDLNQVSIEHTKGLDEEVVIGQKSAKYVKASKELANVTDGIFISKLLTIAASMEKIFNSPQDVEWGIKRNEFYIFQSRPITTLKNLVKKSNNLPSGFEQKGYGEPASPGYCSGILKLIKNENDYKNIKGGYIILSKGIINANNIIPFISKIRGVITTAGLLSHLAIILRELHIPCIVKPFCFDYMKYKNKKIFLDATQGKIYICNDNL